jgi:transcriptional regulator with XRE-family HTH domain
VERSQALKHIGTLIRRRREARGLSQVRAADESKLGRSSLQRIEQGLPVRLETLRIAAEFFCDAAEVAGILGLASGVEVEPFSDRLEELAAKLLDTSQRVVLIEQFIEAAAGFHDIDAYLDSPDQRRWPKRQDMEQGRVYLPQDFLARLDENLQQHHRCLLVGASGSGKTVLAVVAALQWRSRQQGGAVALYLDAAPGGDERAGDSWYQEMRMNAASDKLFVIDNCHLAPAAVNRLVERWEREQPGGSLLVLVSAPRIEESPWEEEAGHYFEVFEDKGAQMTIEPSDLYLGVLRTYSEAYCAADPHRYVPVQEDLADPRRAARLRRLCSENLASARNLLELWEEVGGHLGDISVGAALDALGRRYLTSEKVAALAPLCGLGQFEIAAHEHFLGRLPSESLRALRQESLLEYHDSPAYGRCYRIALHPQVAADIWKAWVRRRVGTGYKRRLNEEAYTLLKAYLQSAPENFVQVHRQLSRGRGWERSLHNRLLADREIGALVLQILPHRRLTEVMWYVRAVHELEPDRALKLLEQFLDGLSGKQVKKRVMSLSSRAFSTLSSRLLGISPDLARRMLSDLPARWVAERIVAGRLGATQQWIASDPEMAACRLGYSREWRETVANALDLQVLAAKARSATALDLSSFLIDLAEIAPNRAKLVLKSVPPRDLAGKASNLPLQRVETLLRFVRTFDCPDNYVDTFLKSLNLTALRDRMEESSLLRSYWFLRELRSTSPDLLKKFLSESGPAKVARLLVVRAASAADLMKFQNVCGGHFMRDVRDNLTQDEVVDMLARSPLADVGTLLEHRYAGYQDAYASFIRQHLRQRLADERLESVGKFVTRILRVPVQGGQLGAEAFEGLLKTDLSARLTNADAARIGLLLRTARSVGPDYARRLTAKLSRNHVIEKALPRSNIHGLQVLVYLLHDVAPRHLARVATFLRSMDLTERIREATARDLAYFLWNVHQYVALEQAQLYCRVVDATFDAQKIRDSELEALGHLLWNLVAISDIQEPEVTKQSALLERIRGGVDSTPGPCAVLLGTLTIANPKAVESLRPEGDRLEAIEDTLAAWLIEMARGQHPYALALATRGLEALRSGLALKIWRRVFSQVSFAECLKLLTSARDSAVTPRSRSVLQDCTALLAALAD